MIEWRMSWRRCGTFDRTLKPASDFEPDLEDRA
jgi:hypothetical protein